jgi:hypothetical protein
MKSSDGPQGLIDVSAASCSPREVWSIVAEQNQSTMPSILSAGVADIIMISIRLLGLISSDLKSSLWTKLLDHRPYNLSMRARDIWICSRCLQSQRTGAAKIPNPAAALRTFTSAPPLASGQAAARKEEQDEEPKAEKEEGAMFRRLAEMTEETIDSGGRSAAKNVEAAGFSEELKKQLEERIVQGAFQSQNQRAFAEAEMPVYLSLLAFHVKTDAVLVIRGQRHTRPSSC